MTVDSEQIFTVVVAGRPSPQGSKGFGEHGQLLDVSPYLAPWRAAVIRAVYLRYRELGIEPAALPLLRGPVGVHIVFYLDHGARIDGPPDGDKLDRATWDALSKARVWEDDARVVVWGGWKVEAVHGRSAGADIKIWRAT